MIQPAEPNTVHLPEYDPWLVYGAPIGAYPGWDPVPGLFVTEPEVLFGLGIGTGAFAGFGWGWHHWGADWYRHRVVHNQNTDIPHRPAFANRPNPPSAIARTGGLHGGGWHRQRGMHYGAMSVPRGPSPLAAGQALVGASIPPQVSTAAGSMAVGAAGTDSSQCIS